MMGKADENAIHRPACIQEESSVGGAPSAWTGCAIFECQPQDFSMGKFRRSHRQNPSSPATLSFRLQEIAKSLEKVGAIGC
jgi:hypothetical protein